MGSIQRAPRGLLDLLSCKDMGRQPQELLTELRPTLEMLQLYGLQQLQVFSNNNAAAAEAVSVDVVLPQWGVLFAAQVSITKTATMTALRGAVLLNRNLGVPMNIRSEDMGPFGATETGIVGLGFWFPYPVLCPPGTIIAGVAQIIGTDATANVSVRAEVGILG